MISSARTNVHSSSGFAGEVVSVRCSFSARQSLWGTMLYFALYGFIAEEMVRFVSTTELGRLYCVSKQFDEAVEREDGLYMRIQEYSGVV